MGYLIYLGKVYLYELKDNLQLEYTVERVSECYFKMMARLLRKMAQRKQ